MKLPIWLTNLSKVKQGISQPKSKPEILKEDEEYEIYIDPKCGCKKRRIIKKSNNETNVKIHEDRNNEIRTSDELATTSKKSTKKTKSRKS